MAGFDLRAGYCPGQLVATILLNFLSVNIVQAKIRTLLTVTLRHVLCLSVEEEGIAW